MVVAKMSVLRLSEKNIKMTSHSYAHPSEFRAILDVRKQSDSG